MVKKFKLVQTYPGSSELGAITEGNVVIEKYPHLWREVKEEKETYWKCLKPELYPITVRKNEGKVIFKGTDKILGTNGSSVKEDTKIQPSCWVESSEEAYLEQFSFTILSFINSSLEISWNRDTQLKDKFCVSDGLAPFLTEEVLLSNAEIKSVKRKSDSAVFYLGQKVIHKNNVAVRKATILNFHLVTGTLWVKTTHYDIPISYLLASVTEEPIVITSDGVAVYKGTEFYSVQLNTFKLIDCSYPITNPLEWKTFSLKGLAIQFIIDNNPCLSLMDVEKSLAKRENWRLELEAKVKATI